jgi:DNA invertase Pin-like site-specific DNA recombinase
MAGQDTRYSNPKLPLLGAALGRFARPQHPEKTLEELTQLIERIDGSEARPARTPRKRAINSERQLGSDRLDELLTRYATGASANAVAREFGISAPSVIRIVRKHGLDAHERLPSGEVVREAADLYASGLSLQKVADRVGVSKSTLRRALLEQKVVLRKSKLDR